jgi:hypothetical protein
VKRGGLVGDAPEQLLFRDPLIRDYPDVYTPEALGKLIRKEGWTARGAFSDLPIPGARYSRSTVT